MSKRRNFFGSNSTPRMSVKFFCCQYVNSLKLWEFYKIILKEYYLSLLSSWSGVRFLSGAPIKKSGCYMYFHVASFFVFLPKNSLNIIVH